jgi:hypothetical protein
MSKQQEPKKPRRQRSKKLNLNKREQWERLLKEVNTEYAPLNVILFLTVNLKDGTAVEVNIAEMLEEGADPEIVERLVTSKLSDLDDIIRDIDFHISVDSVAKFVQPFTDQLLKDL